MNAFLCVAEMNGHLASSNLLSTNTYWNCWDTKIACVCTAMAGRLVCMQQAASVDEAGDA